MNKSVWLKRLDKFRFYIRLKIAKYRMKQWEKENKKKS